MLEIKYVLCYNQDLMIKLEFSSEKDYLNYLTREFADVEKIGEFNVFTHCVTTYSPYYGFKMEDKEKEITQKIEGILTNGLNLDGTNIYGKYGSIRCTAKLQGVANRNLNIKKIAQYDYFSNTRYIHNIILLIPKNIKIDDKDVNFSSFYNDVNKSSQHSKVCLFDAVKDEFCPPEFTFGYQVFNPETQTFVFYKNEEHFMYLDSANKAKIEEYFANKILKVFAYCKQKYGVEKVQDVLNKLSEEHMLAIDDFLMDP